MTKYSAFDDVSRGAAASYYYPVDVDMRSAADQPNAGPGLLRDVGFHQRSRARNVAHPGIDRAAARIHLRYEEHSRALRLSVGSVRCV